MYSWSLNTLALPLVGVFTDSRFFGLYRSFVNRPEKIFSPPAEKRLDDLRALLKHSYENVPFYRDRMDTAGFSPDVASFDDLLKLAPLRKSDINSNFPDRILSSRQVHTPWRYRATSGTIERLTVVHDSGKRDVARALHLFSLYSTSRYRPGMKYLEIPPDVCRNVCGAAETVEPPLLQYLFQNMNTSPETISDLRGLVERQLVFRQKVLPSLNVIGMQRKDEVDSCLRAIDEYRPAVLKALPAYLYTLAVHILERGLKPPRISKCVTPMGSSLSPAMKRTVESAFQRSVHEDYGSAELSSIASECGNKSGLHPYAAYFHIEVVCGDRPAKPGEMGNILITDLGNYAMPFIRYDIGDVGRFVDGPCPCGIRELRLEVLGRAQDCLERSDGSLVSPDEVVDTILADPEIFLFQLENNASNIHVRVVPRNGHAPNIDSIKDRIVGLLGGNPRITARTAPSIPPEQGGKYRFVKNLSVPAGMLRS
jgi:phenylacetate-CoA ligase